MRDNILNQQIEEWWDVFRRFLYAKYPWTKKEVEEEIKKLLLKQYADAKITEATDAVKRNESEFSRN